MLSGKRSVRVGDQLLKELALFIIHRVRDPRISGVTLTGVDVSGDLRNAKVFFSVMGDREAVEKAQVGLDSAKGFIKRGIGARVDLKYMPEISFIHDSSLEDGNDLEKLFKEMRIPEAPDSEG